MEENKNVKRKVTTDKIVTFVARTYPEGTDEIYVCGNIPELGDWDPLKAKKMIPNEKGEFELQITTKGVKTIEYKYLNHKTWNSVERGYVAQDVENRTCMTNAKNKILLNDIKGF